jgi:hypothetical protein
MMVEPLVCAHLIQSDSRQKLIEAALLDCDSSEQFEIGQHFAGPKDHASERIFGDRYRQPRLFPYPLI